MDLYFAGSGSKEGQEEIKRLQCNQLLSYGVNRADAYKWIEFKRANPDYKGKLFIDSGAHSISTGVLKVDVYEYMDGYIDFINSTGDAVDIYAELDDVPEDEDADKDRDTFANSWKYYLYMIERVKIEYRDKVIPVFHFNEDFKGLDMILEYRHPDTGKPIPYIGLAPRFGSYKVRYHWLKEAFEHIKSSSNPDVKTHAFGCTILRLLEQFPVTSADSATWAIASAFGNVRIGDHSIVISDRTTDKSTNLTNKNPALQEAVEKMASKHGFTLEELAECPYKRQVMTIRELKEWEQNYKCTYSNIVKKDLW